MFENYNQNANFFGALKKSTFYLKKYRKLSLAIVVASVASSLFEGIGITSLIPVIQSFLYKSTLDVASFFAFIPVIGSRISNYFLHTTPLQLLVIVFLLILFKNILAFVSSVLVSRITNHVRWSLQSSFFASLVRAELGFFDSQKNGMLVGQVSVYSDRIAQFIFSALTFAIMGIQVAVYLGILFFLSVTFTLFAFGLFLAILPFIFYFLKKVYQNSYKNTVINAQMFGLLSEMFQNVRLIKIFHKEESEQKKFHEIGGKIFRSFMSMSNYSNLLKPFSEVFMVSALLLSLVFGSYYLHGAVSVPPSFLFVYIYFFFQFFDKINGMNHLRSKMHENIPALWEYQRMLAYAEKHVRASGTKTIDSFEKAIECHDVSFAYTEDRPVLKNVSLTIPRGSFVAFVGPTGSGKSTIANLLSGLYLPNHGSILVDNISLSDIEIGSWLKKTVYVAQEAQMFHDSIRNNIAYGNETASFDAIREAAKVAQIDEFIMSLPQGYDTLVGDRGTMLSGGQRQRLALARAILCNPEILILDEATSALDSQTEEAVHNNLLDFKNNRTLIVIAHRLSTVKKADSIYVVVDGEIQESGTHISLLEQNGVYSQLYSLQSAEK